MPAGKRKRESLPSGNDNSNGNAAEEKSSAAVKAEFTPFTIEVLKDKESKPKKRRISSKPGKSSGADWSEVKEETGIDSTDAPIYYAVHPAAKWNSMKKYKNFIVSDQTFAVHDYVFVNSGNKSADSKSHWVGKVLEVRADGPSNVYLRIFWMYWPEELPMGRQTYHGNSELVASNAMEIIDAMTVSDHAIVTHIVESDLNAAPAEGLYWRQKFDIHKLKLSLLRSGCKCESYHNPDKLLVHCTNQECDKWLHEGCLVEDALQRHWDKLTKPRGASEGMSNVDKETETSDVIQVNIPTKATNAAAGTLDTSGKPNGVAPSTSKKRGRGKRARRNSTYQGAKPWEGRLEGKLDTKADEEVKEVKSDEGDAATKDKKDEKDIVDITGKVVITDLRGDSPVKSEEIVECLFCRQPIV